MSYETIERFPGYRFHKNGEITCNVDGRRVVDYYPRKLRIDKRGYKTVGIKHRTHSVHRLILEAFSGAPAPNEWCRHLDGDRLNNNISNLKWGTPTENHADKKLHGRQSFGESHHSSKLTDDKVREIRRRIATGEPDKWIGPSFGVTQGTIYAIRHGTTWGHVA
jgi:hypothetical protein